MAASLSLQPVALLPAWQQPGGLKQTFCSLSTPFALQLICGHKNSRPCPISHSKIQPTDSAILLALQWVVPLLLIQDEMGHLLLKKTFLFPAITWLLLGGPGF